MILHQVGVLAEPCSIVFDTVPREVESDWFLHKTVCELLEGRWHDLNINGVAGFFNALHCALELFRKVQLRHFFDALLQGVRVNHSEAEGRCKGHRDTRRLLEARLEDSFLVRTDFRKQSTVLEQKVGRLEVVLDEGLQRKEILSVAPRDGNNLLQIAVELLHFALSLDVRVDLEVARQTLVEVVGQGALVELWHLRSNFLQLHHGMHLVTGFA